MSELGLVVLTNIYLSTVNKCTIPKEKSKGARLLSATVVILPTFKNNDLSLCTKTAERVGQVCHLPLVNNKHTDRIPTNIGPLVFMHSVSMHVTLT